MSRLLLLAKSMSSAGLMKSRYGRSGARGAAAGDYFTFWRMPSATDSVGPPPAMASLSPKYAVF